MKLKVRIEFDSQQREQLLSFVNQLNHSVPPSQQFSVDEFCRRAVMYAMREAYERAEKAEKADKAVANEHGIVQNSTRGVVTNGPHNTESRNPERDTEQNRTSPNTTIGEMVDSQASDNVS